MMSVNHWAGLCCGAMLVLQVAWKVEVPARANNGACYNATCYRPGPHQSAVAGTITSSACAAALQRRHPNSPSMRLSKQDA